MGHDHQHHHGSVEDLRAAFFLNAGFALLEILGGLLTNSVAILSDALHDFGDAVALGMAWRLERLSAKPAAGRFTYGFRRFSLLAALLNALILIGGSVFILSEAIPRLLQPEETHAPGMIAFALLGVLVNGYAATRLHRGDTMNAKVATWHLIEDTLGWAAVMLVGVVLLFVDLWILDPLLSVTVTLYVLWNVFRNLVRTGVLFLQAVPEGLEIRIVEEKLLAIEGVEACHSTHIWSLDGDHHVLSTHVRVTPSATLEHVRRIKAACRRELQSFSFSHTTVEVELDPGDCSMADANLRGLEAHAQRS